MNPEDKQKIHEVFKTVNGLYLSMKGLMKILQIKELTTEEQLTYKALSHRIELCKRKIDTIMGNMLELAEYNPDDDPPLSVHDRFFLFKRKQDIEQKKFQKSKENQDVEMVEYKQ